MLELAHKLADSDAKFFGGWVLAGVEAHIHGEAVKLENNVLLAKELRVFLVLPKRTLGTKRADATAAAGECVARHVFTAQEIADYVAYTGDENIIHKGEHPIVPGLCMAAWLERELQLKELDWKLSFLSPVYAGDELRVYDDGEKLAAYVGAANVFVIK